MIQTFLNKDFVLKIRHYESSDCHTLENIYHSPVLYWKIASGNKLKTLLQITNILFGLHYNRPLNG